MAIIYILQRGVVTLIYIIMKNISSYFKLCLVLACLSFLACSDDNSIQNFPGGTSAKLLPVKISGEKNGGQTVFVYDDYNRLISCSYFSKSDKKLSKTSELKIQYDALERVEKATYESSEGESYTYTITYEGSHIVVQDKYYTRHIDIDAQGNVLKMKQYYANDQNASIEYNYQYDQKGNLIKKDFNNNYYSYTYDDYNGVYSSVNTPQWFLVTMLDATYIYNNCNQIQVSFLDENGKEQTPTTFKITHTYNENGYPVKYHVPNMTFCGTPPLPESDFRVEYQEAKVLEVYY